MIDYLLFGVLQGNDATNWIRVIPIGIIWAGLYYVVFRFAITKFNVSIPGSDSTEPVVNKAVTTNNLSLEAQEIITALGEKVNIKNVGACATRLRVTVNDKELVNVDRIKSLGATAVFMVDDGVQAVFGGKADLLSQEINEKLDLDN